jgi:hypothetical protein
MFELDGNYWLKFGYSSEAITESENAGEEAGMVLGMTGLTNLFITILIQAINLG